MKQRMATAVWLVLALASAASAQTASAQTAPVSPSAPLPPPTDAPVAPVASYDGPAGHGCFWFNADYVLAWFEGSGLPALVTTSPSNTAKSSAGVLGLPTTAVLFGGGPVNDEMRSGIRIGAGYWFDQYATLGVEVGLMALESQATLFNAASDGNLILARPFTSAVDSTPQAVLVAFPGTSSGAISDRAASGNFYEAHFDLAEKIWNEDRLVITTLFGYRFFRYDDSLRMRQTIFPTGPNFVAGTQVVTEDAFGAENEFHGIDMGARFQFAWQNAGLELLAKLAVGRLHREVSIGGGQTTTVPGAAPVGMPGGVFALSSNSGTFESSDWTIMPELGATLSWRLSDNVKLRVGYSVLFLGDIARAGNQIDTTLNPGLFPPPIQPLAGPTRPLFALNREDVWLQTITFGVEFNY